jgi:hypothetical protein
MCSVLLPPGVYRIAVGKYIYIIRGANKNLAYFKHFLCPVSIKFDTVDVHVSYWVFGSFVKIIADKVILVLFLLGNSPASEF